MPTYIIRYSLSGAQRWGVIDKGMIHEIAKSANLTTLELLEQLSSQQAPVQAQAAAISRREVKLECPITTNQQFLCLGINYESHIRESGLDPAQFPFNTMFTKASSSLIASDAPVARPSHVQLLDYEIELGFVIGRRVPAGTVVKADELGRWFAGLTIVNDLSARDVQLPQSQFYKGKSYRGFGPVGPYLAILSDDEWKRWPELRMSLSVNGQVRQSAYCGEMIHKPHDTLTELAGLQDLNPGDLIATGTPAGCALSPPGKLPMFVARHFLDERTKWQMFVRKSKSNLAYLKPGDSIKACIRTDDGAIDLGEQTTSIVQTST